MTNPYAPPQAVEAVSRESTGRSVSITVWSFVLVTVWGMLTGVFCFSGYYLSTSRAVKDLFGFGGMGVCAFGLPVIAALTVRSSRDHSWVKACCILNVLGIVAFIAAVSSQSRINFTSLHWCLFAVMACAAVMISLLINFLGFNEKFDAQSARLLPEEIDIQEVQSPDF